MDSLLVVILLGIIEGLTEFIPVSSTGHLILAGELLGFEGASSGTFEIVIQFGAVLAVITLYWRRFWDVLTGLAARDPGALAFTRNILLGFLPAAVIGLIIYKAVKLMLETPVLVAVMLILGGIAILAIERVVRHPRVHSVEVMGAGTALRIGLVQCLAMVPGVSRSGATIMGALLMGVERKTAAEYSFFLAVPTMMAAATYDLLKSGATLGQAGWTEIALGFGSAFIVALLVVRAVVGIVSRHGFAPFAWYRIVVGSIALIWLLAI